MNRFFLQILRNHTQKKLTVPDGHVDWNVIYELSQIHEVTGIVYFQCKEFIPEAYRPDFERSYGAALFYYWNRKTALDAMTDILGDQPFFSVKGLEVAQYYPVPGLRTMGDTDIVVAPGRLTEAISKLRRAGFGNKGESSEHVWSCEYRGLHFEIHDRLVGENEYAAEQAAFFNHYMPCVKDHSLTWNFHFLFLLMHLRKHFMESGVGIRQFMDIAVVIQYGPELDWPRIKEQLEELKLSKFADACFSLIETWFDVSAPIDYERLSQEFQEIITEKVLKNGVFGYEDEMNRENRATNALIFDDGPMWIRRIVFLLKNLFPGYERMRTYSGCRFVDGRKHLLPAAWLVRFIHMLGSTNNAERMHTITGALKCTSEIEERTRIMRAMGLIE